MYWVNFVLPPTELGSSNPNDLEQTLASPEEGKGKLWLFFFNKMIAKTLCLLWILMFTLKILILYLFTILYINYSIVWRMKHKFKEDRFWLFISMEIIKPAFCNYLQDVEQTSHQHSKQRILILGRQHTIILGKLLWICAGNTFNLKQCQVSHL